MAITLADYNNLQSSVQQVLGIGDTATYGYGQSVTSSQIAAGSVITSAQWDNLRNDLVNCVLYQNGGDTSNINTILPPITQGNPISSAILTKFQAAATTITTNRNPAMVPSSPVNQGTRATLGTDSTYTGWSGTITESINTFFGSISASKFFFNSGGLIEFSATLTGSSGTLKDNSWSTFFSSIGTVRFGLKGTTQTGTSGGTTSIGSLNLTTTDQVIFTTSTTGTYLNVYEITARSPAAGQIIFTVKFNDSTGIISGVDSLVTGTTTSICKTLRANSPNLYVVLPAPTAIGRNSIVVNAPTYAITANFPGIVDQGSGIQKVTVSTTNVAVGTVLYWTTDFASTKGSTQGTVTIDQTPFFNITTLKDNDPNTTLYTISLRVGSYTGQVVASATASIRAAVPSYSISPDKTNMTENSDTVTFTVSTTAVPNGTSLFWKTNAVPGYNSINAPDFVSIPSSYITISGSVSSGTATISLTTVPDYILEGTEAFTISVHLNSTSAALATSPSVYISDTSTPSVSLSVNKTSVQMGGTVSFSVFTKGYTSGTTLYWGLGGTAAPSRSVGSVTTGSFTVTGNTFAGSGTFTVTIATDTAAHGVDTFYAVVFSDAARTVVVSKRNHAQYPSLSNWTLPFPANTSVALGYSAPDGTNTAGRLTCRTTGPSLLRVAFNSFTPNGSSTLNIGFYAKLISGTVPGAFNCDLTDAAPFTTYTSQLVTNTWVYISLSAIPTATAKFFFDLLSDNTTDYVVDYWGLRIEDTALGGASSIVSIAASGNLTFYAQTSWTVPTGVTSVNVTVRGGGGGATGNSWGGGDACGGAGGGGGGYGTGTVAVTPGSVISVITGGGGGGGTSGNTKDGRSVNGGNGSNSSFLSVYGSGGNGSTGSYPSNGPGAGGTGSTSNGTAGTAGGAAKNFSQGKAGTPNGGAPASGAGGAGYVNIWWP